MRNSLKSALAVSSLRVSVGLTACPTSEPSAVPAASLQPQISPLIQPGVAVLRAYHDFLCAYNHPVPAPAQSPDPAPGPVPVPYVTIGSLPPPGTQPAPKQFANPPVPPKVLRPLICPDLTSGGPSLLLQAG